MEKNDASNCWIEQSSRPPLLPSTLLPFPDFKTPDMKEWLGIHVHYLAVLFYKQPIPFNINLLKVSPGKPLNRPQGYATALYCSGTECTAPIIYLEYRSLWNRSVDIDGTRLLLHRPIYRYLGVTYITHNFAYTILYIPRKVRCVFMKFTNGREDNIHVLQSELLCRYEERIIKLLIE